MNRPKITRREWRNVLLFAVIVMAITTGPYLAGAASQRPDRRFGWFTFGIDDGNSYLAKMREGATDGWLFKIVYTSEPHDGAVLFMPYLLWGKLAALITPPSSPGFVDAMLLIFHIMRIGFGILLIVVMYRFIAAFIIQRSARWLALILICLAGGFGWLLILLGQTNWLGSSPIDFYSPEGYTFYLLYGLPHLSLARAAFFGGLLLTFDALILDAPRQWLPRAILAGLCWLIVGLSVPFFIAVLYVVLGVWGLATWLRERRFPVRLFWRCLVAALIPAPYLIYDLVVFTVNPVMKAWQGQNLLPSPHPLHYVFGYGLLAILAIPAIRWAWRRGRHKTAYLLLPAWVIAGPVLAYLPIGVQKRFLEGIFVPLCILAVVGLRYFWIQARTRHQLKLYWRNAAFLVLVVTLPTNMILLLESAAATQDHSSSNPMFHSGDQIAALDWLNANAPASAVALSDKPIGNYLPARTNLRAFVGHGPETINFYQKLDLADQLLRGEMSLDRASSLFETNDIQYVIVGLFDPQANLKRLPLNLIYDQGGYKIYEVRRQP